MKQARFIDMYPEKACFMKGTNIKAGNIPKKVFKYTLCCHATDEK
jgi:hypothetical protein